MNKIRSANRNPSAASAQTARPAQAAGGGIRQTGQARPIPPQITQNAVARSIVDAARQAQAERGSIGKRDLEAMLERAMQGTPGQPNLAAAEAIDYVVEQHSIADDAKSLAGILKDAKRCRHQGEISQPDLENMMRRAWDADKKTVDPAAATALRFVGWRDAPIMDKGARQLMSEFVSAWYQDRVEAPNLVEGRRQIEAQLAQDKMDFRDFVDRDKAQRSHLETRRLDYDDYKEQLRDQRLDTSEWQSMMLWLQTGVKQDPITS